METYLYRANNSRFICIVSKLILNLHKKKRYTQSDFFFKKDKLDFSLIKAYSFRKPQHPGICKKYV